MTLCWALWGQKTFCARLQDVIHCTLFLMLKTSKEHATQKARTNTPSLVHVPKALIKEREYSCVIAAQRSAACSKDGGPLRLRQPLP